MAIDPQFLDCMNQTIAVAKPSGVSDDGDQTYAAPADQSARVQFKRKIVKDADGEERVSEVTIYTDKVVEERDRIWLPGDSSADDTLARMPMAVEQGIDVDGSTHHYEVMI